MRHDDQLLGFSNFLNHGCQVFGIFKTVAMGNGYDIVSRVNNLVFINIGQGF